MLLRPMWEQEPPGGVTVIFGSFWSVLRYCVSVYGCPPTFWSDLGLRKRVSVAHITRYLLVPGILIFGSVPPGKCFCYCSAPLPPFVRRCPRLFPPPLLLFPSLPLSSSPSRYFCHQLWRLFVKDALAQILWKLNVNRITHFCHQLWRG